MEKKYIFFESGPGCLVFWLGLGGIFAGILFFATQWSLSKYVLLSLITLLVVAVVWGAFKVDGK